MHISHSMSLKAWLLLVVLSLIWGTSFLLIEVALTQLQPFTIVAFRLGIAAIVLLILMLATGHRIPQGKSLWISLFIIGLLNNALPFSLIAWAQTEISSSLAAILNATTPLFTILLAHYFTHDERTTPNKIVGVLVGLVGIAVIFAPSLTNMNMGSLWGQLAALASSLSYALAIIFSLRYARLGIKPIDITFGQLITSAIIMIPAAIIFENANNMQMPPIEVIGAILVLSIVNSGFAYILYFKLIAAGGATNASLVTITIPPVAIVLGISFLGESFLITHAIGISLIGVSLLIVNGYIMKFLSKKRKIISQQ